MSDYVEGLIQWMNNKILWLEKQAVFEIN